MHTSIYHLTVANTFVQRSPLLQTHLSIQKYTHTHTHTQTLLTVPAVATIICLANHKASSSTAEA